MKSIIVFAVALSVLGVLASVPQETACPTIQNDRAPEYAGGWHTLWQQFRHFFR